ncbi:MAG: Gfo/Idh/MocA family oxidoreductase [Planctomyces sp.]|nr:Gfo/Idh/MocA family oxidoreductase [Planctomyces sp.]
MRNRHVSGINRREFVARAALAAAPLVLPRSVFGANDRIRLAFIGVRNQGTNNLKAFQSRPVDIVAVCDVDAEIAARAAALVSADGRPCDIADDYRRILDRDDVDGVVITTPDHWHARMTIDACQAGKDVYCEKPLSLTVAEGRRMVDAARQNARVVQTGSQQRSSPEFRKAVRLVRGGALGDIRTVLAGLPECNHPGPLGPDSAPPSHLNYDAWLGPAPWRPYNEKRVHYNFRFWWDYSGGQMTNFGAHHIDIAQWGLDADGTGPVAVEGQAEFHPDGVHEVAERCRIVHAYASGVRLIVGQQQPDIPQGTTFIGERGRLHVNRGRLSSEPREIVEEADESRLPEVVESNDHHGNFLECMANRANPIADVEIGHRSATVCHLGNIVARLGRGVRWDPETETISGDAEAQAMLDRPARAPWG